MCVCVCVHAVQVFPVYERWDELYMEAQEEKVCTCII